jgi:hypothetical protein
VFKVKVLRYEEICNQIGWDYVIYTKASIKDLSASYID